MRIIKQLCIISVALVLASCNNSGSSSSGSSIGSNAKFSGPANFGKLSSEQLGAPDGPTSLGELSNGSQIIIAEPTYIEPQNGAFITSLSLTSNSPGEDATSYTVSFSTTPINNPQDKKLMALYNAEPLPSVTAADDCVLSGNKDCDLTLVSNNAPIGTYEITPVFTNITTGKVTYGNSFTYDVRHDDDPGCHHDDGKLAVKLNSTNISNIGETIYGTISLTDVRYDKSDNVEIEIYPTNPSESGIAKVNPQTCTVSAKKNCAIGITGLSAGTTSFVIKAVGSEHEYKSVTTPRITVHAPVVAGYLNLKITPNSLNYNGDATAEVTLESSQSVSDLTVHFGSENPNLVQIENSCTIENSNPGSNTCEVRLHAESTTGFVSIVAYVPDSSYIPVARVVSVHPQATSGHLAITLQNDAIWYGQTTIAQVALVDSSYVAPFSVNLTSSDPNIAKLNEPTNCILSTAQPLCQVTITAQNTTGFSDIKAAAESYDAAQTTLEVYPTPITGSLSMELTSPTIAINSDSVAIVRLNYSQNVKDAVVTINSDNTDIAKPVGNNTCHLSSINNTCEVIIHSNSNLGSAEIYTTANYYLTAKEKLNVVNPGTITMTPSSANLEYGQSTQVTVTLNNSVDVANAKVELISNDDNIVTVTSCNPKSVSSGNPTCTATVAAGQTSGPATISTIVTSDGYLYPESSSTINVTPNPLPGQLSVSDVSLPKNQQAMEMVSLNNSRLITKPVNVQVISQDPNIATNIYKVCSLTTASPTCDFEVAGKNVGSTNMIANSSGYTTAYGIVRVDPALTIPKQCVSGRQNALSTTMPFDAIQMSYDFAPFHFAHAPNGVQLYSNGTFNVLNWDLLHTGSQIATDASSTNPVTIGSINYAITPGTQINGYSKTDASCGGGWASSEGSITPTVSLTNQGKVKLHLYNNSTGQCGGQDPQHWEMDVPYSSNMNNQMVYSVDRQGCGNNNNWDMWGNVFVTSKGCVGDKCTYQIRVNAGHGGDSWCNNDTTYDLTFTKPQVYMQLTNLGNFNEKTSSPTFVGGSWEQLYASIGNDSLGGLPSVITCQSNGWCKSTTPANIWYTNGLHSFNYGTSYTIVAPDSDNVGLVCTNFEPS